MVVREYLVENFGFDDSQLKTLGLGKQTGSNLDADWGSIQIVIFPAGTEIPAEKLPPASSASGTESGQPVPATAPATHQP
jgi:hypothetical protein